MEDIRSPLMENTGLLNHHDHTVCGAFTSGDIESSIPSKCNAMLQLQQYLVIDSQQGTEDQF